MHSSGMCNSTLLFILMKNICWARNFRNIRASLIRINPQYANALNNETIKQWEITKWDTQSKHRRRSNKIFTKTKNPQTFLPSSQSCLARGPSRDSLVPQLPEAPLLWWSMRLAVHAHALLTNLNFHIQPASNEMSAQPGTVGLYALYCEI